MKKKILSLLVLSILLISTFAGCKKDELPVCTGCEEEKECKTYVVDDVSYLVCDDCYEEFATGMGLQDETSPICSLCEIEKECKTYTIDGIDYIVCDDCYDEFAYAFGLDGAPKDTPLEQSAPIPVCSLCEMEKDCDTYTVDGLEYIVCPDCYNEFATAFGLNGQTQTASEE